MTACDYYFVGPQMGNKLDKDPDFCSLRPKQMCSRLPGMNWITLKGPTTRAVQLLQRLASLSTTGNTTSPSSFYPKSFVLPDDECQLIAYLSTVSESQVFILKPSKGSQGKGIVLALRDCVMSKCKEMNTVTCTTSPSGGGTVKGTTATTTQPFIVQDYISIPHTIRGYKYDLRLYVVVTSVSPLQCWVYKDGLARFCTELYSTPTTNNIGFDFMHLTNYSLNCDSPTYDAEKSKQKLSVVANMLCGTGTGGNSSSSSNNNNNNNNKPLYPTTKIFWNQIISICKSTMHSFTPFLRTEYENIFRGSTSSSSRCFHILGVDIMIDKGGTMTLLEVNCNPSLNCMKPGSQIEKSVVDVDVKTGLLCGTLRLVEKLRNGKTGTEIALEEQMIVTEQETVGEIRGGKEERKGKTVEEMGVVEEVGKVEEGKGKTEREMLKEKRKQKCEFWSMGRLPFYPIVLGDETSSSATDTNNEEKVDHECRQTDEQRKQRIETKESMHGVFELQLGTSTFVRHRSRIRRGKEGGMTIDRSKIETAFRHHSSEINSRELLNRALSLLRTKYGPSLTMNVFFQALIELSIVLQKPLKEVFLFFPQ